MVVVPTIADYKWGSGGAVVTSGGAVVGQRQLENLYFYMHTQSICVSTMISIKNN